MQPAIARCILAGSLLAAPAVPQDDPLFRTLHIEMTQGTGTSIAAGDLDGDDRPDLVVEHDGSLRPLAGRGDGSFVLDLQLALPGLNQFAVTQDLAVADVDGDGVRDVLASGGALIDLLIGQGDLTFDAHFGALVAIGDTAQLAVLDLDGDGDADVVAGNRESPRITVHLNAGGGVFLPYMEYGDIPQGFVTATGDWDLDGDPDLVFGEYDGDGLDLLFNDGAGAFGTETPLVGGGAVASVAAGDLDEDGDADLAASAGAVRVLAGDGGGGFALATSLPQGFGGTGMALADMDEDGHVDIVLATGQVSVYAGHGNLSFAPPYAVPAGLFATEFVLGDFDRDGEPDLAGVDSAFDGVSVALGRGADTWFPSLPTLGRAQRLALADFDHDGRLDLVSAEAPGTSMPGCNLTVARGGPQGALQPVASLPAGSTPVVPAGVWAGPIDDDGDADIAFAPGGFFGGSVQVWRGDGALGFDAPVATVGGNDLRGLDAADFDADGHTDVVTSSNSLNQDYVLYGRGDGSFEPPLIIGAWFAPNAVIVGDWNDDGLTDFAVGHSTSSKALQIHLKSGGRGFLPAALVDTQVFVDGVAAGDVNLDGHLDLAAGGQYSFGGGQLFLGDGTGAFLVPDQPLGVTSSPVDWAIGDLDNDGLPDLLAAQKHGFEDVGGVAFLAGHGNGSFAPAEEFALPANAWAVELGDLDLDGVTDAVVALDNAQAVTALLSRRGPWDDLQQPLAGAAGYANQTGEGPLHAGTPCAVTLSDAPPLAAVFHVAGLMELSAPFKGGVLVPQPDLLNGPLPVGADGTLQLAGSWPAGAPSGVELLLQFWWPDAGGPQGFAASRALRATLP